MPAPQLSVVIPVYNNSWLTERCLRELDRLRADCGVRFEAIVVDNASSDDTPQVVGRFPWVRYLRHDVNENFAGACNAGAGAAQSTLTFFLNNDAYPLGDALAPLVRAFERDEVAIAGGALFFEDGVTQAAGLAMLPDGHWHYFCRNLPPALDGVERSRDALGVSGAAMAVRTQWFLDEGGFDRAFVNGFEDVDLCMRARRQGRAIAYVAAARFAHYEAASENRFAHELENERLFQARWSADLRAMPKTLRGDVGAIVLRDGSAASSLEAAALEDLEAALRAFGHPVVRGNVPLVRRFDRRFRRSGTLGWFTAVESVGIAVERGTRGSPTIRTRGATDVAVPFIPCASPLRIERSSVTRSADPECRRVGVIGGSDDDFERLCVAAASPALVSLLRIAPDAIAGGAQRYDVLCCVHLGLSDESAFGNVVLAMAGIPSVIASRDELLALFQRDVVLAGEMDELPQLVARIVADPQLRERIGQRVAADAKRRFSPRRSAIRVVDLLCAARFGLERPPPHTG
ncbi:MAG: glycosyltransferase [Candidatus Eremiobacteraeota bacterium]|nr:glycosyltransferase [Candidatus Eremiobacteraeota bacterium]